MIKKGICGNKLVNIILFCGIIFLLCRHTQDFEYSVIADQSYISNQRKKIHNIKQVSIENNAKAPRPIVSKNIASIDLQEKKDTILKNNVIVEQKNLTLNKLASGFHAYADNKIATREKAHDQSITHQRFLEKIVSCIQTLFFINKQKLIPYITTEKTVDILLELKRNGFLNGIIVSKTSGDHTFDTFIKGMIEEAAKSFPPIPQLIEKVPYYFVTRISCEHGISLQLLVPR